MSRPAIIQALPAAPVHVEPEGDEDDVRQIVGEALPSWLTSLVVHLALVLLLALVQVVGSAGGAGVMLDCVMGGGDAGDNNGADDAMAMASELPSAELHASEPAEPVVTSELTAALPVPEIANPLAGGSKALEPGGGSGEAKTSGGGNGDAGDGIGLSISTGVFGVVAEGQSFVYVFDRSDSMNSELVYTSEGAKVFSITPLQAAKAELIRSLDVLNAKQRFHVLFYNHEMWALDTGKGRGRLVPATDRNKAGAKAFVESVYGHGNTHHIKPLETAIRMKPDVIFLLTDGEEKDDPSRAQVTALTRLNGGQTKINVVQFCYKLRTQSTLIELANENEGRHIFMSITQLAPVAMELSQQPKKPQDVTP